MQVITRALACDLRENDPPTDQFLLLKISGKTSLLNALCGRAFYGEVTGEIKINGKPSSIEAHASSVGFVPQVMKQEQWSISLNF